MLIQLNISLEIYFHSLLALLFSMTKCIYWVCGYGWHSASLKHIQHTLDTNSHGNHFNIFPWAHKLNFIPIIIVTIKEIMGLCLECGIIYLPHQKVTMQLRSLKTMGCSSRNKSETIQYLYFSSSLINTCNNNLMIYQLIALLILATFFIGIPEVLKLIWPSNIKNGTDLLKL